MRLFRRKATGRHALGAAVTSIPSGPPPAPVLPAHVALPVAPAVSAAPPVAPPVPVATSATERPAPAAASRVQLGFRDGSSASLHPASSHALQLEQLARALTKPR